MDVDSEIIFESIERVDYPRNISCNYDYVPSSNEYIESLGTFAILCVSLGAIFTAITLYLAIDVSYQTILADETKSWKRNVSIIVFVYPIASLCNLVALAMPRAQLLSEAVTQIYLTVSLYRLYLFLIDIGRREVKKSPSLNLRVGPCCCWPCLPFPDLAMSPTNLSWLQIIVLQLPVVQTLVYCVFVFMSVENPLLATRYAIFLQPLSITSILLGLYGLSITTMSLHEVNPGLKLRHKASVVQMVLFFSKLQGFVIKGLAGTGLFPCNSPVTPQVYCNFTYNALMLIEMVFLCYAARHFYATYTSAEEHNTCSGNNLEAQNHENNNSLRDGTVQTMTRVPERNKRPENNSVRDETTAATNNNEAVVRSNESRAIVTA